MRGLNGSNARTAVIAAGVAALVALGLSAAPALATGLARTAPAAPVIVSGVNPNTVFLTSSGLNTTLGRLRLSRGAWTIFAKASVEGQPVQLDCNLTAGGSVDEARTNIDGTDFDEQVALNVTHVFRSAGSVTFTCQGFGVSEAVNEIKMTAIKAGTLTSVRL